MTMSEMYIALTDEGWTLNKAYDEMKATGFMGTRDRLVEYFKLMRAL